MKDRVAPTRSPWQWLDRELLGQHRHPVHFFQRLAEEGVWRVLWPTRLLLILAGVLLLPGSLWVLTGERWTLVSAIVAMTVLLAVSGFWMILTSPIAGMRPGLALAYLLLYHFSLPMLAVALLCGLAALTPIGLWGGWLIGIPLLLGISFVDTGSVTVYLSAQVQREKRTQQRRGGPPATLPELPRQRLFWWLRLLMTGLLLLGALFVRWWYGAPATFLSVMLVSGAVGCVRLEAILLATLGQPLVMESAQERWCATYVGRTALWVGRPLLLRTLVALPANRAGSRALLALLQEGSLGLPLQQAWADLPPADLHARCLHLSLCAGGAAAIQFLYAKVPSAAMQQLAYQSAALATEAAKPPDLQRWLALLPATAPAEASAIDPALWQMLALVRTALLQYRAQPVIASASTALQHFVQVLDAEATPDQADAAAWSLSWPVALAQQLAQQQQQFSPSEGSYGNVLIHTGTLRRSGDSLASADPLG